jgi:hypothetical protein
VVVVLLLLGAGYVVADRLLEARVRSELAALRQAGFKTTVEEVAPEPTPETDAAAALLRRAHAAGLAIGRRELARCDSLGYDQTREPHESIWRQTEPVFPLLCSAARYEAAIFGLRYQDGWDALVDSFRTGILKQQQLLAVRARVLAARGQPDSALANLGIAVRLSTMCVEPMLLYHHISLGGLRSIFSEARRVAPLAGTEVIEAFRSELTRLDPKGSLVNAVGAEVVLIDGAISRHGPNGHPAGGLDFFTLGLPRRFARQNYLRTMRALAAPLREPWGRLQDALTGDSAWGRRVSASVSARAVPNTPFFLRRAAEATSERDVTDIGLAVTLAQRRSGRNPTSLAGVMPEVPTDPFSGRPYGFRAESGGFVVYGVGPDRCDDGADPANDIVWRQPWQRARGNR